MVKGYLQNSINNMKIVAIIQARIGSSRLPGKILMDIAGKPMLWHVVHRLRHSKFLNQIVVATTQEKQDEATEKFCREEGIECYRGSEDDVLDRYYQAAKKYQVDPIVRITADCPLIDPEELDKVIAAYLKNKDNLDGADNVTCRTYPRGLDTELFSFRALEKCWQEAKGAYQREHVTLYIKEHPELFKIYSVKNNQDYSHWRLTVDEIDDLKLVREIYKRLYQTKPLFLFQDIIKILKEEPELLAINKHIKQKIV